jgi:hypothetical protein
MSRSGSFKRPKYTKGSLRSGGTDLQPADAELGAKIFPGGGFHPRKFDYNRLTLLNKIIIVQTLYI